MSKSKEAAKLLDDLDSLAVPGETASGQNSKAPSGDSPPQNKEEAEALAFLEEITQKSSEPPRASIHLDRPLSRAGTPNSSLRKPTERVRIGGGPVTSKPSTPVPDVKAKAVAQPVTTSGGSASNAPTGPGWGWGSVWNTASAAIQQAKTVVDEQVKHLPKNEQARKWGEGVLEYAKNAQLEKIGQDFRRVGLSTLTDILNVVAPPISEHEVIQIWLSHDMQGYDGIESLVYKAFSRILQQVDGGDLIVNRGDEPRQKHEDGKFRDLSAVEGFEAAFQLAQASLEEVIKRKHESKPTDTKQTENSTQNPVSYSYVYLRVQPVLTSYSTPSFPGQPAGTEAHEQEHLQYILYLSDPSHEITHTSVTQAFPSSWLEIWDKYEWVEDLVAEALRVGVEVVGQEYIVSRMGWGADKPAESADAPATDSETEPIGGP